MATIDPLRPRTRRPEPSTSIRDGLRGPGEARPASCRGHAAARRAPRGYPQHEESCGGVRAVAKPWRQKGTGRARQGTTRAAQWAGGGVVFGPVPRSYEPQAPEEGSSCRACAGRSVAARPGRGRHGSRFASILASTRRSASAKSAGPGHRRRWRADRDRPGDGSACPRAVCAQPAANVKVLRVPGLNVPSTCCAIRTWSITKAAVAAIEERLGTKLATAEAVGVNIHDVIQRPLVTEKSNIGREEQNLVTLAVDPRRQQARHPPRRRGAVRREGARRSHDADAPQEPRVSASSNRAQT